MKCEKCILKMKCSQLCLTCIYNKYAVTGLDDNYIQTPKEIVMKCKNCNGKKTVRTIKDSDYPLGQIIDCPDCNGTGEQPEEEVIKPCQHLLNTIDDPKKAICMKCGEEFAIAY